MLNPDPTGWGESATSDIDTRKIRITFFEDKYAKTKNERDMTLPELGDLVGKTSRPNKEKLPLLKLASFGDKPSPSDETGKGGGSLRWDDNTKNISGIELDYDGEEISFDAGLATLKEMGCRAIAYTTPSHTPERPRWRLLLPTSETLPNDMRKKLAHRVNGFFGCIFKGESFALSQSFYYGKATNNRASDHHVEIVEGTFVDLQNSIYRFELAGTPKDKADAAKHFSDYGGAFRGRGFENIIAELGDGPDQKPSAFHEILRDAVASYVASYKGTFDDAAKEKLKTILRDAIDKAPKKKTPQRNADIKRYRSDDYLDGLIASAVKKFTKTGGDTVTDFVAYLPLHNYIYIPTREPWVIAGVNSALPAMPSLKPNGDPVLDKKGNPAFISASAWLDKNAPVKQITWAPGEPMLIPDRLVTNGGWIERKGVTCFNLYRPPTIALGDASDVAPWLNHIKKVYPSDADHIVNWLAHRVQRPQDKINHALFLGGEQGIGKDTILTPVKQAVGAWNFEEVSPTNMLGRFNGFLKSVILRVSEARDLGEVNRYQFYEHMKTYTASPPDVLRVDEKNLREHSILNCTGVVITSNYKTNGIYLPAEDRRNYVAWSNYTKDQFKQTYWDAIYKWYDAGGAGNVAAYLATLDISSFNAKAPPKKTDAFWAIVNSNLAPEEAELADALDELKFPAAVTIDDLSEKACSSLYAWINEHKNRRAIPHRLESCGYVQVPNPDSKQGLWRVDGVRQAFYAKATLSVRDQIEAVRAIVDAKAAKAAAAANKKSQQNQGGPS